ncbi:hypothetical protein SK3146_04785 [Paenibacillus konkukensis]|uniref:SWIM-type domain-containing protein n=1 Tax=Paenibacillus konkukensis TaxID=2020716 RepID=A0ABY4RV24_9BACL|nr:SWIM zinc finger family protein [Paenibacillus konkukensis]UQZ85496.1 hypothetical protein SK3146_04785 [Paenibacillus konkukensis]
MSLYSALDDEQWPKLLEQVASSFNEVTLSRGFNYFKQQRVVSLISSDGGIIKARVTGTEDYTVTLKLHHLRTSSCSCPVQSFCKHMAAVIMELADRLGYPASQVVNAKHSVRRLAAASAPQASLQALPGMDVFGWHKLLEQYTAHIQPSYDQGVYVEMLRHQLQKIRSASVPFTETDRAFFELHQSLFILHKLKEQNSRSTVNYYTSFMLYRIYDDTHMQFKQLPASFDITLSMERLKQTLAYVRQLLTAEEGHKYLDYGLYTALWTYWIAPYLDTKDWASQEIGSMEQPTAGAASASLSAAKAFLLLQQQRSQEAWAALEGIDMLAKAPASLFLSFLKPLSDSSQWETLIEWLLKCAPFFYSKNSGDFQSYMVYWKAAADHVPEAEPHMWSVLEEAMPHSVSIIEDMLYERQDWKPWLELQMMQGRSPFDHRVSVLQPIEKEAPELLLPFYHQAIEHYVSLKNRQDYKLAVKLLKRLAKVYKKMKRTERWDRFFAGFLERNSRLRALHEEIKKGKLSE